MPIKHVHESLLNVNENTFLYINFSAIVTQIYIYIFWLTQVCIFNFEVFFHKHAMWLGTGEVKH